MIRRISTARASFRDVSLRAKLMLTFSTVFILLLVLFVGMMYAFINTDTLDQMEYSASQSFSQAYEYLGNRIDFVLYASNVTYYDTNIQRYLEETQQHPWQDLGQEYREISTIWTALKTMQSRDLFNIKLYVDPNSTYAEQGVNFGNLDELMGTEAYRRLAASGMPQLWLPPWEMNSGPGRPLTRAVSMLGIIRAASDYNRIIGAQLLSVQADDMDALAEKANSVAGGLVYLINGDGALVASSDWALSDRLGADHLAGALYGRTTDWGAASIAGESYYAISRAVPSTDWYLTALVPQRALDLMSRSILTRLLLFGVPVLCVALLLVWLLANSMSKRIVALSYDMEAVAAGDWSMTVADMPRDEIGRLYTTYQYMLGEMRSMAQQQYENGKSIKQAELKVLQAQINPHFLYNTLDLINWKARDLGANDIVELTRALARYYKLSLGKGRDFVPIRDEFEHLTTYTKIQNFRFDNRIDLRCEAPDELLDCEILKLVLQPLVENAILHGIDWEDEKNSGYVRVYAERVGDDIVLSITDHGVGMDPGLVDALFSETPGQDGYGLRNIQMRLKLCYGEGYGLSFSSPQEGGTTVRVRIPFS